MIQADLNNIKGYIKVKNLKINSLVMSTPMAGITDYVYRKILRQFNKDSLLSTEMISSEALWQKKVQRIIMVNPEDNPISFQISGHKPDLMLKSALKIQHLADIIDVNMGCPIPKIVKIGDGCALMKTPELAAKIVKELSSNLDKPVSVKFRLGWDNKHINFLEFAQLMEENGASLITLHGRTRTQIYAGEANWELMSQIKKMVSIPVIANGDVDSPEAAKKCLEITGCDAIGIGRGLLGDPWLLHRVDHYFKTGELLPESTAIDRLDMAIEHCKMLMEMLGEYHGLRHCRKFFGWYVKYIPGSPRYRAQLMILESFAEVQKLIEEIKLTLKDSDG